ncbi:hypothetical protein QOT17_003335 [Balamuthia mandrillaris]
MNKNSLSLVLLLLAAASSLLMMMQAVPVAAAAPRFPTQYSYREVASSEPTALTLTRVFYDGQNFRGRVQVTSPYPIDQYLFCKEGKVSAWKVLPGQGCQKKVYEAASCQEGFPFYWSGETALRTVDFANTVGSPNGTYASNATVKCGDYQDCPVYSRPESRCEGKKEDYRSSFVLRPLTAVAGEGQGLYAPWLFDKVVGFWPWNVCTVMKQRAAFVDFEVGPPSKADIEEALQSACFSK